MCCSDDRLLRALIEWTKPWIDTDDSSLVRAVCMQIWQGYTESRSMKDLWDWAGEEDGAMKDAIVKETLVAMAEEIVLGRLISATTPKGITTRVCHSPPSHFFHIVSRLVFPPPSQMRTFATLFDSFCFHSTYICLTLSSFVCFCRPSCSTC